MTDPATGRSPRRVLVTGGSGMLGSHVVDRLIDRGAIVRVVDHAINEHNLSDASASGRLEVIEASITDHDVLTKAVAGCDTVVHLAATLMNASQGDPVRAFDVNVAATHALLWTSAQAGVERIVLGSSVGVYGVPTSAEPITEASPIETRTFYGASKFSGELFARAFSEVYGLDIITLRIGTLYGDRLHPGGLYPGQLLSLLDRRGEHHLDVSGAPDELHDFLYVGDAAEAVALATTTAPYSQPLNIVSGHQVTWRQIIESLLRAVAWSPEVRWVPRPEGATLASRRTFSAGGADQALGFRATTTLDSGMRALAAWHSERVEKNSTKRTV